MAISGPTDAANAGIRRLDPAKYTDLASYINEVNKPDNRDLLVKTYGNQGITGFLKLTGAVKAAGTAEDVTWWEEQRLHPKASFTTAAASGATVAKASQTITVSAASSEPAANTATVLVREGDILLAGADNDVRVYVHNVVKVVAGGNAVKTFNITPLDNTSTLPALTNSTAYSFPIIGNMFAAGTDQQSEYIESNVVKRTNGYNIIKEIYKVTGSQATNIGWINLGGGDYRWYIKSEQDTRQRFLDKREMMMLLGQKVSTDNAALDNISGSEGYFDAVQTRGISSNDYIETFAQLDDLIVELDKQGAGPEYAFYCNRTQDLKIDDMLAAGLSGSGMTAGVAAQFGAFNNSKDSAVELGFRSFGRGGYTFHKHSWKLLNEPTLLGGIGDDSTDKGFIGVMVPMSTVVDPKSGDRNPSLEMNYKSSNGYSREMEHWMTGSILGATNDTKDLVQFNYRSECNLVTRAANRHVILKKTVA